MVSGGSVGIHIGCRVQASVVDGQLAYLYIQPRPAHSGDAAFEALVASIASPECDAAMSESRCGRGRLRRSDADDELKQAYREASKYYHYPG